ncbi:MAG: NAD(P)-dependent oxidoreductase [Myxococcales bacterium]|nr:MAG: NAD(P)-dependent oxidoreductase [Myxococcales bacterium]
MKGMKSTEGSILAPDDVILVTGGAGFIGSHLVRMLLARGYRVRVLDTFLYGQSGLDGCAGDAGLEIVEGDICNVRDMMRAAKDAKAVIALAALVGDGACELDHDETIAINIESTKLLCNVVQLSSCIERVVFASSCSVYGATEGLVLNEGSLLNPVSFYARSRIVSETILSRELEGKSVAIMRLGTVFGASARLRLDLMVNTMTCAAVSTGRIRVTGGEAWRPHVHCCDVANAFLLAAQAPHEKVSGEIFNVGSDGNNFTISETAVIVASQIPGTEIEYLESVEDTRSYRVNFDKIRHVLGFAARYRIEDGVQELRDVILSGGIDAGDFRYSNLRYLQERGFRGQAYLSSAAGAADNGHAIGGGPRSEPESTAS